MRRPEDTDEQVYDFQVAFLLPNDPKEHVVGEGQVSFGRNECFRVFADGDIHSFGESGVYRAICRVKPTGSDKWQSQSYPIIVDVVKVSAPTPLATTG